MVKILNLETSVYTKEKFCKMYKIVFIVFLLSCQSTTSLEVLEGCEYFFIKDKYGNLIEMEHKGNCENLIHLYQDTMYMSEPHNPARIYVRQVN